MVEVAKRGGSDSRQCVNGGVNCQNWPLPLPFTHLTIFATSTTSVFHTYPIEIVTSQHEAPRICFYLPWLLFFIGNWLIQTGHVMIMAWTPVRAEWLDIDRHLGALLLSIFGVTGGIFR